MTKSNGKGAPSSSNGNGRARSTRAAAMKRGSGDGLNVLLEQRRKLIRQAALELAALCKQGDDEGIAVYCEVIGEMMRPALPQPTEDLQTWKDRIAKTPEGRAAIEEHEQERAAFFERYADCKAKAGLSTMRDVATKAGVSVTTVQGIESGRLRPQFRTIEKLAQAFGVPVSALLG